MLSTVGAIILSLQATFTIYFISNPPIELIQTPAPISIPYKKNPVLVAVVDHYNNKGPWAGTFKIDSVIKFKIIKVSDTESVAHVKYHYVSVPNNPKGRIDSGYDQRVFTISNIGDDVKVTQMGPYKSAIF